MTHLSGVMSAAICCVWGVSWPEQHCSCRWWWQWVGLAPPVGSWGVQQSHPEAFAAVSFSLLHWSPSLQPPHPGTPQLPHSPHAVAVVKNVMKSGEMEVKDEAMERDGKWVVTNIRRYYNKRRWESWHNRRKCVMARDKVMWCDKGAWRIFAFICV